MDPRVYRADATDTSKLTVACKLDGEVNIDSVNVDASDHTGHDLYLTTTNVADGTWTVTFDTVAGLDLASLISIENKTQGFSYITKGATVGTTSILIVVGNQLTGVIAPVVTDELEIIYRGVSRFSLLTDATQKTQLVDGAGAVIGSIGNALDVNIASGVTLTVDLDESDDSVEIYGSDDGGTTQRVIKTDAAGELQVDILSSALPSGAVTESGGNLADINTNTTILSYDGLLIEKNVTTGTTAEALGTTTAVKKVRVIAKPGNTNNVYVGPSNVSDAIYEFKLAAGQGCNLLATDIADIFLDVDTSGEGVYFQKFN